MVDIRHRRKPLGGGIPTSSNRRYKQKSLLSSSSSGTFWDVQTTLPSWLVLIIALIVLFFVWIHHHHDESSSHDRIFLDAERHSMLSAERVSFFRRAQQQQQQHNTNAALLVQEGDNDEDDHHHAANQVDTRNNNNDDDDDPQKTPQENLYWRKQQEEEALIQKEREELDQEVKVEKAKLAQEREAFESEQRQALLLEMSKTNGNLRRHATTKQHAAPKEATATTITNTTTTSATANVAVSSSLAYLQTLSEQHQNNPHHWTRVCFDKMEKIMEDSNENNNPTLLQSLLLDCAQSSISSTLVQLNQDVAAETTQRHNIANLLENYTCTDPTVPESPDIAPTEQWEHTTHHDANSNHHEQVVTVHIKHSRKASRIHVLENFIDEEECQAMEEAAQPKLHVATTADGKGGSRVSDARKAMQAGIHVPWNQEKNNHPIARLSRRVYDYTNHALGGLQINEYGQEDLMSIQYKGSGDYTLPNPDRYTPHCDGDCTGLPHKTGTRMATMVMYCTVPDVGGATNFRNANVHVVPQAGSAVFFSYIDPLTNSTDHRYTEHSGCPVYEGEKKIVTQWIRLGVTNEEPWTAFNTLGIKFVDAKKYE